MYSKYGCQSLLTLFKALEEFNPPVWDGRLRAMILAFLRAFPGVQIPLPDSLSMNTLKTYSTLPQESTLSERGCDIESIPRHLE